MTHPVTHPMTHPVPHPTPPPVAWNPTPPYGPVHAVTARPTNGLAIATLVLGLCGLAVLPVVLGHVALRQIRRTGEGGIGLAVTGLVLGYAQLALYVVLIVVAAVGGAAALWA